MNKNAARYLTEEKGGQSHMRAQRFTHDAPGAVILSLIRLQTRIVKTVSTLQIFDHESQHGRIALPLCLRIAYVVGNESDSDMPVP